MSIYSSHFYKHETYVFLPNLIHCESFFAYATYFMIDNLSIILFDSVDKQMK